MRRAGLLTLLALAGCRSEPPPAGSGAREAAYRYFDALVRSDWPAAYSALAAESRKRVSGDGFARLAAAYRRGLAFDPDAAHVTACEEHGDGAIAHVSLTGKGRHGRRFKEAVTLRREPAGWAVVLPATFGRGGR
ncbi:MAG: hypothetical protein U0871_17920 [Gemmataceae bacterium]